MKTILALMVLIFASISNATERVTMKCVFVAVASGYVDKRYSVNLILDGDKLYNADGTRGNNRQSIYGQGSSYHEFNIYDGNSYRMLYSSDLRMNNPIEWTLNTGEVACQLERGWSNSYYSDNKTTVYVHDTVVKVKLAKMTYDQCSSEYNLVSSWDAHTKHDTLVKYIRDTVFKTIKDTIIKVVKDSTLDSSKATQRFSLRGKYVGLAANETDCEFYTHFLKYNDTVFNEQGEYVDSFEIKLLYTSGSYYKTIKLERNTLLALMGHPAIYPTRKGNYYITTERNWNEESIKDWSKVKPSSELQKQVDRLRAEINKN